MGRIGVSLRAMVLALLDYPVLGVVVAGAQLAKGRDRVKRFIGAVLRGARFIGQNRSETVRIMSTI